MPCHQGFTAKDPIVRLSGDLAVIDFELSRPDLSARDLARLAALTCPRRSNAEEAFLRGYGLLCEVGRQRAVTNCLG